MHALFICIMLLRSRINSRFSARFSRKLPVRPASSKAPLILSVSECQALRPQPVLLDTSWFMPGSSRNSKAEFSSKRIQGASGFLDLDEVASPNELGLKHMMPSSDIFAHACGKSYTGLDFFPLTSSKLSHENREVWDSFFLSRCAVRYSRRVLVATSFVHVSRIR